MLNGSPLIAVPVSSGRVSRVALSTSSVGRDVVAGPAPAAFRAVTRLRIRLPSSASTNVYVVSSSVASPVVIFVQPLRYRELQRSHSIV